MYLNQTKWLRMALFGVLVVLFINIVSATDFKPFITQQLNGSYSGATIYDQSNWGNDGIDNGSMSISGNTLTFNECDDCRIWNPRNILPSTVNDFSIEVWIKPDDVSVDREFFFFMHDAGADKVIDMEFFNVVNRAHFFLSTDAGDPSMFVDGFQVGQWAHIVMTVDAGGYARVYWNGTEQTNTSIGTPDYTSWGIKDEKQWGGYRTGGGTANNFDGDMQFPRVYNKTLSAAEVSELYSNGKDWDAFAAVVNLTTTNPTFIPPTPANDTTNNTQVTINVSCVDGYVHLWFNNTKVINNLTSPSSYTTAVGTSMQYTYTAGCYNNSLSGYSGNVTRVWTYDVIYPTITLNGNNAFNQNNYSQIEQYLGNMTLNITFADNHDLYAYSINITKNINTVMWNRTNESLSGTSEEIYYLIDVNDWAVGWYDIELRVSDSHTAEKIPDYQISKQKSKITFKTENDNNIKIETSESADIDATKFIDRYNFEIDFDDGLTKQREFHVKTDKCPLIYREKSGYKAHFISFCDFSGNWIDFEGVDSDYQVIKIDNYHYKVIFDSVPPNVVFNSIGGLNILTVKHRWYVGNITEQKADDAGISESSSIEVEITRDATHENFTATLIYNGTTFSSPTIVDDGSTVRWNQTVTTPATEGTINYIWVVTYNQTDTTEIQFNITGTQDIYNWSVFNCTSGNVTLWFNLYNEDFPSVKLNNTLEIEVETWIGSELNTHQFLYKYEGSDNYALCIYPNGLNQTMNLYAKYYNPLGYTHRYILYDYLLSNTSQNLSLYNTNTTTGYSELSIIARNYNTYRYYPNVVSKLLRKYVSEGIWRTVQMDESGEFGNIIYYIKEQNTDYKILYYDTDNNLLKESETLKFTCVDSLCEYTQLINPYEATSTAANISVIATYNNVTKILNVQWADAQANNNKVEVRVSKNTITGYTSVCDTFQTGAAGTVNCNLTGYSGEVYLTVLTSNSPYAPLLTEWIKISDTGLSTFLVPAQSSLWTGIIMLTILGFGLWSSVAALITTMFGLIFLMVLNLLSPLSIAFVTVAAIMAITIGLIIRK